MVCVNQTKKHTRKEPFSSLTRAQGKRFSPSMFLKVFPNNFVTYLSITINKQSRTRKRLKKTEKIKGRKYLNL